MRALTFIFALILLVTQCVTVAATEEYCLEAGEVIFDTSSSCDAVPTIRRVYGAKRFMWKGVDCFAVSTGNEIDIYNVTDPKHPVLFERSNFRMGNVGDEDTGLYNFSFCDDCRYAVANYSRGSVFVDLGTKAIPEFNLFSKDVSANLIHGSFVFKNGSQLYLVAEHSNCVYSGLHRYNNEDDREFVECIDVPGQVPRVVHGEHIDEALYLADSTKRVFLFNDELDYISTPCIAYSITDSGMSFDGDTAAVANNTGLHIFNVSDSLAPVEVGSVPGNWDRSSINGDKVIVAKMGVKYSERTFDISTLDDIIEMDAQFWSSTHPWNFPPPAQGDECTSIQAVHFIDESTIYLLRESRLQIINVIDCPVTDDIFFSNFETGDTSEWSNTVAN